jgi:hypothetical protein
VSCRAASVRTRESGIGLLQRTEDVGNGGLRDDQGRTVASPAACVIPMPLKIYAPCGLVSTRSPGRRTHLAPREPSRSGVTGGYWVEQYTRLVA